MSRALAHAGVTGMAQFDDPVAAELLSPQYRSILRAISLLPLPLRRVLSRATLGGLDLVPLRAAAIDAVWLRAQQQGVRQIVILGAGLDGRAWRLPHLQDVGVWEVDHPATQASKYGRVAHRRSEATLHFVPVDFAHDDLGVALAQAAHDASEPTLWIWEGVAPYLPMVAVQSTLSVVQARSAPGSRIALSYIPATGHNRLVFAALTALVARLGEPFVGLMSTAQVAELLNHAGLLLVADTDAGDWARQGSHRPPQVWVRERLAEAIVSVEFLGGQAPAPNVTK